MRKSTSDHLRGTKGQRLLDGREPLRFLFSSLRFERGWGQPQRVPDLPTPARVWPRARAAASLGPWLAPGSRCQMVTGVYDPKVNV